MTRGRRFGRGEDEGEDKGESADHEGDAEGQRLGIRLCNGFGSSTDLLSPRGTVPGTYYRRGSSPL